MSRRPQQSQPHSGAPAPRRRRRLGRLLAGPLSVAGHGLLILALLSAHGDPPKVVESAPMIVALVAPPPPPPPAPPAQVEAPPAPAPPAPAKASTAKSSPAKSRPRPKLRPPRTPPPADVETLAASDSPAPALADGLGEAALIGATTAGGGGGSGSGAGGGGACDMVRLLQDALRKNPRVRSAVVRAHPHAVAAGKAVMLWDGDWVKSPGQEGKGLAGLREAIILEVAFAPKACRTDPMRGLVLISLNDSPGSVRLALGSDQWRWSDLLFAR
jgi:hypothetical protein